ncbi:MAG TPA: alternative ribosome rescue aminoacyl-tRNA hydrolase ArfB [Sphingobacterium sp.]|nr:alternative ribosome rescue aminoacyl-tRNA hydrolase ArfB [Sphingobacterium sp.]
MGIGLEELRKEVAFKTSRSSGAGGQNVNKVETKVTLLWDVTSSGLLSHDRKEILLEKLASRRNADGWIQLDVSETRSQLSNKDLAVEKLLVLVTQALKPNKKRIPTKISRAKILERLDRKKLHAAKKSDRRWRME